MLVLSASASLAAPSGPSWLPEMSKLVMVVLTFSISPIALAPSGPRSLEETLSCTRAEGSGLFMKLKLCSFINSIYSLK